MEVFDCKTEPAPKGERLSGVCQPERQLPAVAVRVIDMPVGIVIHMVRGEAIIVLSGTGRPGTPEFEQFKNHPTNIKLNEARKRLKSKGYKEKSHSLHCYPCTVSSRAR